MTDGALHSGQGIALTHVVSSGQLAYRTLGLGSGVGGCPISTPVGKESRRAQMAQLQERAGTECHRSLGSTHGGSTHENTKFSIPGSPEPRPSRPGSLCAQGR